MEPLTNTVAVVTYLRLQQQGFDWKNFSALDIIWSLMAGSRLRKLVTHEGFNVS